MNFKHIAQIISIYQWRAKITYYPQWTWPTILRNGIFAETFAKLWSVFLELPLRYYQKMSAFDRKEEDELIRCSGCQRYSCGKWKYPCSFCFDTLRPWAPEMVIDVKHGRTSIHIGLNFDLRLPCNFAEQIQCLCTCNWKSIVYSVQRSVCGNAREKVCAVEASTCASAGEKLIA